MKKILLLLFALMPIYIFGQVSNFEDMTQQGWDDGGDGNTITITNQSAGNPDGYFLFVESDGIGAGGRWDIFNTTQWAGNYTTLGINKIKVDAIGIGSANVTLRLLVEGSGGNFVTKDSFLLQSSTGWHTIEFSVAPSDLIGNGNATQTLNNVSRLGIFIANGTTFPGPDLVAEVGIDNIMPANSTATNPIENEALKSWKIFPNPITSSQFSIELELEKRQTVTLECYNTLGQLVKQLHKIPTESGQYTYAFNTKNLMKGNYWMVLKLENEKGVIQYSSPRLVNVQ